MAPRIDLPSVAEDVSRIESLAASVESVEKTVEDGFDLSADQLLWEMLQA